MTAARPDKKVPDRDGAATAIERVRAILNAPAP
jgi:hypothetical protein